MHSRGSHDHFFRGHADLERHVHDEAVLHVQLNGARYGGFESFLLDTYGVVADPKRAGEVLTGVITGGCERRAMLEVAHGHLGAGHHCAAGVPHGPHDVAGVLLRAERWTQQGSEQQYRQTQSRKFAKVELHDPPRVAAPGN